MLKVRISRIGLMVLPFVFCLFLSGVAAERECWDSEGGGSTSPGNCTYIHNWHPGFQYGPNNPQVINRETSVNLSVIGGVSPYLWSVSGSGFNLDADKSYVKTNILTADSTACGTATITVTDAQDTPVTGYVRCTTGTWILKTACDIFNEDGVDPCLADGKSGCRTSGSSWEKISGNTKWVTSGPYCFNEGGPTDWSNCSPPCGNSVQCASAAGATSCDPNGDQYCQDPHTPVCQHRYAQYYEWQCE